MDKNSAIMRPEARIKCYNIVNKHLRPNSNRLVHIFNTTFYYREFGTKCTKCTRSISSNDWVRRARDHVFHLACFACDNCKRQLSTGEEFALHDSKVLCKAHYVECVDGGLTGMHIIYSILHVIYSTLCI